MTFAQYKDLTFGALDLSSISSGRLLELSLHLFDAPRWDGLGSDEDTTETFEDWMGLYSTLYSAATNPAQNTWLHPDSLISIAQQYSTGNQVALMFLDKTYHRIRNTAINEGLLTLSADQTRLLDVPNRTQSPYDPYQVFSLGIFKNEITQFGQVNFVIPSPLWLSNLTNLQMDFGDGVGWRTVTPGMVVSVNYKTTGSKYIKGRTTTAQGTKTAQLKSIFNHPGVFAQPTTTWTITASRAFQGIRPTIKADLYLGCGNVLDRPIIVLEGFDVLGDFTKEELFEDLIQNNNLYALMYQQGYDFIFVNSEDNGTFIEANANAVESLITYVNAQKTGNFQSTLMGFSMGGLVARWCLRDMENRGIAHQVANYFSIDAPHQGANIPLGMQCLFTLLNEDVPYARWIIKDLRKAYQSSRTNAAKQMQIRRTRTDGSGVLSHNFFDPLRLSFAQALLNLGYPQQSNNFAIAFGSGNAVNQGYNSGEQIYKGKTIYGLFNTDMEAWAVPANNNRQDIARYFFVGFTFQRLFGLQFIPTVSIRSVWVKYRGQHPYDIAPGGRQNTQQQFESETMFSSSFGRPFHNFVSTVSALDLNNQSYNSTNNFQSANLLFNVDNGGVVANNLTPFDDVLTISTNLPNSRNETHDLRTLNFAMGDFIMQRVHGSIPNFNCLTYCTNLQSAQITGSNQICTTDQYYELQNLPTGFGLQILWEITGPISIEEGQGTNRVRIKKTGNGIATIKATINTNVGTTTCPALVVVRNNIIVGAGAVGGTYSYSGYIFPVGPNNGISVSNSSIYISLTHPLDPNTTYTWQITSQSSSGASANFNSKTATIYLSPGKFLNCICNVTTPCGTASASFSCYNYAYGGYSMLAYPNPSDEELNVETISPIEEQQKILKSDTENETAQPIVPINEVIQLIDANNQVRWKGRLKEGKAKIPTKHLPNGIYYLRIEGKDKKKHTRQILIRH